MATVVNATANATAAAAAGNASACEHDIDQEMVYHRAAFWLEGVGQIIIGVVGIVGNCMAVPVLVSKRLNSIFNRILVFLTVFDNAFIFCSIMEG